ncbi:MAG: ABC-F family ATP-binding cassette domain-containing protein [Oscillibacter sp.]
MIEIQAEGVVKSFEIGKNVLDGLTFQIDQGERVGLLGRNGAGKTTLFKIMTGEMDCDEGLVTMGQGRRIGLISQIPVYPAGYAVEDVLRTAFARLQTLAEEMESLTARMAAGESDPAILRRYGALSEKFENFGGYDTDVAVNKVASGLSITPEMRAQQFDSLSGGEKTRVNLGRLILEDTDVLLLDEPTNHLDLHATEWLEEYISRFKGTVVAISHDRYFLDRVVTRVIEIADGKAEFYSGNYSFYALEKERRYQERLKQYQKEQAKIDQLTEAADRLRLWAFMGNDATFKRAASMEKRIERMRTTAKPSKSRKMDARFASTEFHGDEVLALRNVAKGFGDKLLFEGINLKVEGGERIALIGDNGTGKSTLVSMITEETYPDDGRIKLGPAVKYACLPQIIHFDHPDWNLVENMMAARRDLSAQSARNRLAAYEFRGEDVFKPVSVLSGGEQSRLRLCMLMDDEINFLILDEPTNHLDIDSREWMEDAVEAYDGTLLFVSHDRYFINRFATRIWELADGTITDYPMGFTQYRQMKAQEELQKYDGPKPVKEKTVTERSRSNRGQQAARRQLTIVERDVAKTEERLSALDGAMEAAACDYEKLGELLQEKELVQAELEALYEKWEALSEEGE